MQGVFFVAHMHIRLPGVRIGLPPVNWISPPCIQDTSIRFPHTNWNYFIKDKMNSK